MGCLGFSPGQSVEARVCYGQVPPPRPQGPAILPELHPGEEKVRAMGGAPEWEPTGRGDPCCEEPSGRLGALSQGHSAHRGHQRSATIKRKKIFAVFSP